MGWLKSGFNTKDITRSIYERSIQRLKILYGLEHEGDAKSKYK